MKTMNDIWTYWINDYDDDEYDYDDDQYDDDDDHLFIHSFFHNMHSCTIHF